MSGKPAKGFLISDVESSRVIDRSSFVGRIECGQGHIAERSLCGAFYPTDVDRSGEFDCSGEDTRMSDLAGF